MLVGPTGCGKTTFRKNYLSNVPCISPDDFIVGKWSVQKARLAWQYAENVARMFFANNESFVVDAQFVTSSSRNEWVKFARNFGYKVHAVCFNTPWRQLLKNHKDRGARGIGLAAYGKIPLPIIRNFYNKFKISMRDPSNWHLFNSKTVVNWGDKIDKDPVGWFV